MRLTLSRTVLCAIVSLTFLGCDAEPTGIDSVQRVDALSAVRKKDRTTASVLWNERAVSLLEQRLVTSNSVGSRVLTYLSLAQYRAVRSAEGGKNHSKHVSVPAAVAAASATVLGSFFPLDAAALEAQLQADLDRPRKHMRRDDVAAGVAIGRAIATDVLATAATDGTNAQSPGAPPVGPAFWISSGAPIAQALYRTRPFFIPPASHLGTAPPPAFGSAAFLRDLEEVRRISDTRTPEQTALAQLWAKQPPPGIAQLNLLADELLNGRLHQERDAARLLAYANAAVFDAQIACYEAKFTYWFLRPVHADPAITMVIGLQNHPSYPSTHSCITAAFMEVLGDAFPRERRELDAMVEEAGVSRIYGGIHFRYDVTAGQALGRRAAKYALKGRLD